MVDAEVTVPDIDEDVNTANVDTKSLTGVGGKTVHRQAVVIGDPNVFARVAEVNANNELRVKQTDAISISNSFATEATLAIISTNIADIEALLTSLNAEDFATQTTLASVLAAVDGIEALLASLDSKDFATEATQATLLTLAGFNARINTLGQKAMAASTPVVISSDQSAIPVSLSEPISVDDGGSSLTIDGAVSVSGTVGVSNAFSTEATLALIKAKTDNLDVLLSTRLAESTFTTRIPVNGQAVMASSIPVVIASNQSAIPITDNSGSVTVDAPVGTPVFTRLSDGSAALVGQKTMANSLPVVISSDQANVPVSQATAASLKNEPAGNVAHDGTDSGNPIKIGGQARTTNPTAVGDGDRVNAIYDDLGKQVVVLNQVRDLSLSAINASAITNTTETTIIAAAASTLHDVTGIIIANSSAVETLVEIRDDTAGTVKLVFFSPAKSTVGISLASPLNQAAANKNWTAKALTTGANIFVTMQYVKNV